MIHTYISVDKGVDGIPCSLVQIAEGVHVAVAREYISPTDGDVDLQSFIVVFRTITAMTRKDGTTRRKCR